jgi:hypothetical protein
MKNYLTWLSDIYISEGLTADQEQMASMYGYKFVDEIRAGGFNVYLLNSDQYPSGMKYHIAFEREGLNVFDMNQQFNRPKSDEKKSDILKQLSSMEPICRKIDDWIKEYGQLVMASTNEKLTDKWMKNLSIASRWLGIEINSKVINFHGHQLHVLKK